MTWLRQGIITAREDGPRFCVYVLRTNTGVRYPKLEEDVIGQPRLEVGQRIWFAKEADGVGFLHTRKPGRDLLLTGVIEKAHLLGDERIQVFVRTENGYFVASPWIQKVLGNFGQRLTIEQRHRTIKAVLEGQPYVIRIWPRAPFHCDLIKPGSKRKRRVQ